MAQMQTNQVSVADRKALAKAAEIVLEQMFAYYDRVAVSGGERTGSDIRQAA
mgnify:FL=1